MALKSYRELEVWQRAMDLAEAVYVASRTWDPDERFGLISQSRRAAGSVTYNIAEGYGRIYRKEYVKHLGYARGSLFELESQLILATRIGAAEAVPLRPVWRLAQRVAQMLNKLINSRMRSDLGAVLEETRGRKPARRSAIKGSPSPKRRSGSSRPNPESRVPARRSARSRKRSTR